MSTSATRKARSSLEQQYFSNFWLMTCVFSLFFVWRIPSREKIHPLCSVFLICALCATKEDDNCSAVTRCAPVYVTCVAASASLRVDLCNNYCAANTLCDDFRETGGKNVFLIKLWSRCWQKSYFWPPVIWLDQTIEGSWKCPWNFSSRKENRLSLSFSNLRGMKRCQDKLFMQPAGTSCWLLATVSLPQCVSFRWPWWLS